MPLENLPAWLRDWLDAEVAAGRARSPEEVVLTGEVLRRAQAWLEDRVFEGVAPSERIDGRAFMAELGAMVEDRGGEGSDD
jgi:hypothetical protein